MTLADRIVLMKDGCIEQMGTPEEIYAMPETLFAAGFIGTPGMNFLAMNATDQVLMNGSTRLDAPRPVKPGPVIVGVSPGAFKLNGNAGHLRGRVKRNEFHGETRLLTLQVVDNDINVTVAPSNRVKEGETIGFDVDAQDLNLFDPSSGRRLAS